MFVILCDDSVVNIKVLYVYRLFFVKLGVALTYRLTETWCLLEKSDLKYQELQVIDYHNCLSNFRSFHFKQDFKEGSMLIAW